MDFIEESIWEYISAHTTKQDELLHNLYRETWQKAVNPRMLSGAVQGQLLSLISKLSKPKYIVEVGTFTGYSAICLSKGLQADGRLVTIDINDEIVELAHKYFELAGLIGVIDQRIGNAQDILPRLDSGIDLVFLDGDKQQYLENYQVLIEKITPGGLILADNTLWSGKVADEKSVDPDTQRLRKFNDFIQADDRVENVLLPLRDGLTVIRKKDQ